MGGSAAADPSGAGAIHAGRPEALRGQQGHVGTERRRPRRIQRSADHLRPSGIPTQRAVRNPRVRVSAHAHQDRSAVAVPARVAGDLDRRPVAAGRCGRRQSHLTGPALVWLLGWPLGRRLHVRGRDKRYQTRTRGSTTSVARTVPRHTSRNGIVDSMPIRSRSR